ncbi:hypothetical protein [Prevotella sp. OH937_COT-195]|uniref:hypothetical protein n=1 Tax=Prevotella sp. OH937_COT-195 TaxID=2491051 RepID=UPI000F648B71|nr:hypothetical protein [Prevotella sp. OH937_COT-195]RRC97466.1 hypothetical protein EII32_10375 [Prevotella sp. OH937_COT-195]
MDERLIRKIQREGAEALLDAGVSLPLLDLRIPLRKQPVRVRLTMKRPTLARQIKIAHAYLTMDTTAADLDAMDVDGQMRFLARHGKTLSNIIALTMDCRWLPVCVLSWLVRHRMKWEYQKAAFREFVLLMGTQSFMTIIRSAEMTNPMRLRLSRGRKGS